MHKLSSEAKRIQKWKFICEPLGPTVIGLGGPKDPVVSFFSILIIFFLNCTTYLTCFRDRPGVLLLRFDDFFVQIFFFNFSFQFPVFLLFLSVFKPKIASRMANSWCFTNFYSTVYYQTRNWNKNLKKKFEKKIRQIAGAL